MSLQRVKQNRTIRESMRLLKMRDELHAQLGDAEYQRMTGIYTHAVTAQIKRHGCPKIATTNVLELLDIDMATDPAVKRLVMCAALDVVLTEENLPLAV